MREIKFRYFLYGEMHGLFSLEYLMSAEHTLNYNHKKFMQFTGLKDRSGVEIYEGDIVEFTYWWFDGGEAESVLTGVICYSDANMSFQLKGVRNEQWQKHTGCDDYEYLTPFSELNFEESDFRVIGNKFQNHELLGEDHE